MIAVGHGDLLYLARLLSGGAVGMLSAGVPIYITEVAPTRLRGPLGAAFQVGIALGILLVYVLGSLVFRVEDAAFCQWRWLAWSFVAPAGAFVALALCVPES